MPTSAPLLSPTPRFLGTTISQDLKQYNHIDSIAKKAVFPPPAKEVQPATGETVILCHHQDSPVIIYNCLVWFSSATKRDIRRLQWTVRKAERIIGALLPSLQELYTSRVRKRAKKVTLDPSHPAHSLFELLPSGRHYRALSTKTARHKNSFYPQVIPHLNIT